MLDVEPDVEVDEVWEPDEVDTFLFSAALWLPHRIHYDHAFAVSQGHRGLVVHGPLQVARLLELVSEQIRPAGGRILRCTFKHESSACVGDRIRLLITPGAPAGDGATTEYNVKTVVVDAAGHEIVATSGQVVVAFDRAASVHPPANADGASGQPVQQATS
jgi:3-methylfumaryl-CoA hydratase